MLTGSLALSTLDSTLDLTSPLDSAASESPALHRVSDADLTTPASSGGAVSAAPSSGSVSQAQPAVPAAKSAGDSALISQAIAVSAASHAAAAPVTAAPVHASQFGGAVPGTSTSHGGRVSAPIPLAPQATNTAVQSLAAATPLQNFTDGHWTTLPGSNGGGINPLFSIGWSTYVGTAGDDSMNKIAIDPSGNVILAGTVGDPTDPTINDLAVIQLDPSGSTLLGSALLVPNGTSGDGAVAHGLAVDSNGVVYVSGTVTIGGVNSLVAARISDFTAGPDWTVSWTYADPANPASAGGAQLDASGTFLYVTGSADVSAQGGSTAALIFARLTDLANSTPTLDSFGGAASYVDASGNSVPTVGIDIGVRSDLSADVVGQGSGVAGNFDFFGLTDGTTGPTLLSYGDPGPNSSMNAVYVDGSDNAYYAGSIYANGEATTRAIMSEIAPDGATQVFGVAWGVTFGGAPGDWVPQGLVVSGGTPYETGYLDDGSGQPGTTSITIDHFAADGSSIIESDDGTLSGSGDDYSYAITTGIFNNIYVAGKTTSPDFNTTPGAFQTSYQGGNSDGFAAQVTLA
jgi:hypothetical protein